MAKHNFTQDIIVALKVRIETLKEDIKTTENPQKQHYEISLERTLEALRFVQANL